MNCRFLLVMLWSIILFFKSTSALEQILLPEILKAPPTEQAEITRRKKILIFYSKGGGAHLSAAQAIKSYLEDLYTVTEVNLLSEVLYTLDPIRKFTFSYYDAEDFYNYLISSQWAFCAQWYSRFGLGTVRRNKEMIDSLLTKYIKGERPDLIISVMPIFNGALAAVCKKLQLPFLVVPADMDTWLYAVNIPEDLPEKFAYVLAFNDPLLLAKVQDTVLTKSVVRFAGFPLRKDFFTTKDRAQIREDFEIPPDKPVIMLLMGAAGSSKTIHYLKRMALMNEPVHIVVCIGRNEKLRKRIAHIVKRRFHKKKRLSTVSVIGFTRRIADIMAVSDILVTKPGPTSVCEAIESQVPLVLDATSVLCWEQVNIDFVIKHGCGRTIERYRDIAQVLDSLVHDKAARAAIKKNMGTLTSAQFGEHIRTLVKEFLLTRQIP